MEEKKQVVKVEKREVSFYVDIRGVTYRTDEVEKIHPEKYDIVTDFSEDFC